MSGDDKIIQLHVIHCRGDRPPPLSDAELIQLRGMLAAHEKIACTGGCPVAESVLRGG